MFGNFDMKADFKIPKGIVSMIKSFGLDAHKIEADLFKMGKDAISLLNHCDERLTALANQHQLLHGEKEKLVAEVARLHSRFSDMEQRTEMILSNLLHITEVLERKADGSNHSSPDPGSAGNRSSAS